MGTWDGANTEILPNEPMGGGRPKGDDMGRVFMGGGPSGGGGNIRASIMIDGVLYSPEEWDTKQIMDRLERIEKKLDELLAGR